jgi:hypothetical protein
MDQHSWKSFESERLRQNARHCIPSPQGDAEEPVLSPKRIHLRDAAPSLMMAWLLLRGLWPAAPAEPRPYDFLLETATGIKRVQVKTSNCSATPGSWAVGIGRHAGGGARHNAKVPYLASEVDLFAIIDGGLNIYLIPIAAVAGRKQIYLGQYDQFLVGSAATMFEKGERGFVPRSGLAQAVSRPRDPAPVSHTVDGVVSPAQKVDKNLTALPSCQPAIHATRWTESELRSAVRSSTSWADVLRLFGYKPSSTVVRRALQRESNFYGVDTSHFSAQRRWSDHELIGAAATTRTWPELLIALGLSANSKSSNSVRTAARRLGVELGHIMLGPKAGRDAIGLDLPDMPAFRYLRNAAPSLAAAWFAFCGCAVSLPCEPTAYDLVADLPQGLMRVQVKSTTSRNAAGSWVVNIGHRPEGSPIAARLMPYSMDEVDLFIVLDGDLLIYLIPAVVVAGKVTLSLRAYSHFVVNDASSLLKAINPARADGDLTVG